MSVQKWVLQAPENYAYDPDEMAAIGRAVEAFRAAMPEHFSTVFVKIEGLNVLLPPRTPASMVDGRRVYPRGERPPRDDERPPRDDERPQDL
jgi:hypothetical protein